MTALRTRLLRASGDEGIGMIVLIGVMTVVMTLIMVTVAVAQRSLDGARKHDAFSTSLAAAETGVDQVVARTQRVYDVAGDDSYVTPAANVTSYDPDPDCVAPAVPYAGGSTPESESAWAEEQLVALASVPGCLKDVAGGQYVALKPTGRQAVYAMGWSPSFENAKSRSRVLKTEYIFAPYRPSTAVLTGGDLEISSSTTVTGASSGSNSQAGVHSNGVVTVGGGNPTVTGTVSQSGNGPLPSSNRFQGGSKQAPRHTIPTIEARSVYGRNVADYLGAWFDLCPDGKARAGATTGPCTGAVIGDYASGAGLFRNGWSFSGGTTPPTWQLRGAFLDGVYFVHQGNVGLGNGVGNPTINRATIIASSVGTSCNKVGGNIDWNRADINAPYINNLFMLADQDLRTGSNFKAGSASGSTVVSGMFVAGDQVELQTSSSGAYGSVLAGDECSPSGSMVSKNVVKNPSIYFDPTGYAPFTDIINTTLWLELVG